MEWGPTAGDADLGAAARRHRDELRRAAEEVEEELEQAARAERDLLDVVLELMHRGDVVRATVGERSFAGVVVHAGEDLVTLADRSGNEVDLRLPALAHLVVVERARAGGRARSAT